MRDKKTAMRTFFVNNYILWIRQVVSRYPLILVLAIIIIATGIISPASVEPQNLLAVSKLSAVLGVIGRLVGLGARPEYIGLVSDADGAIVALATAYKIAELKSRGEALPGDVIVSTHICPCAIANRYP